MYSLKDNPHHPVIPSEYRIININLKNARTVNASIVKFIFASHVSSCNNKTELSLRKLGNAMRYVRLICEITDIGLGGLSLNNEHCMNREQKVGEKNEPQTVLNRDEKSILTGGDANP